MRSIGQTVNDKLVSKNSSPFGSVLSETTHIVLRLIKRAEYFLFYHEDLVIYF